MVRYILDLPPRSHIGQTQLNVLGLLNISDRVQFIRLSHVFKILNMASPLYLKGNFNRIFHAVNTRASAHNLFVPQLQGIASKTFFYNGIKDWNRLSSDIKSTSSLLPFKTKVRQVLVKARLEYEKV